MATTSRSSAPHGARQDARSPRPQPGPWRQVKSVYNDFDGLSRDDRIRYDSPALAGFSIGGSAVSGDAYDTVLFYSRAFGSTQMAGALAWAKTGDTNVNADDQYDGSFSILLGNGLNATVAAGLRNMAADYRDDGTFWYTKLGYRADIFSLGKTSFSVDYGKMRILPIMEIRRQPGQLQRFRICHPGVASCTSLFAITN